MAQNSRLIDIHQHYLLDDYKAALATLGMVSLPDAAHAGGIMTSILYRLSKFDTMRAFKHNVPKGVATYLNNLYFDMAQATDPATLQAFFQVASKDRVMFGTDYPQAIDIDNVVQDTLDGLDALPGFDAATRAQIMSGNALKLFPRFA